MEGIMCFDVHISNTRKSPLIVYWVTSVGLMVQYFASIMQCQAIIRSIMKLWTYSLDQNYGTQWPVSFNIEFIRVTRTDLT